MTQTAQTLSTDATAQIIEALNQSVAETAVTTMLAQNFHWNVTGMAFGTLHALFQTIYEDHFEEAPSAEEMIRLMKDAQETLAETSAGAGETAANHGDTLTEDMCIERGQIHEKFAWMLRAHLK